MTIKLDKSIYDKDAIYKSIEVWKEYLHEPLVSENKSTINIELKSDKIEHKVINEFLNYVLDLTSSMELS